MTLLATAQILKTRLQDYEELQDAQRVQVRAEEAISKLKDASAVLSAGKKYQCALELENVPFANECLESAISGFLNEFTEEGMILVLNPVWTGLLASIEDHIEKVKRDVKTGYKTYFQDLEVLRERVGQLGDFRIKRTFDNLETLSRKAPIDEAADINATLGTTDDPSGWPEAIQKRFAGLEKSISKEEEAREALSPEVKEFQRMALLSAGFPLKDLDEVTLQTLRDLPDFDRYVVIDKGDNG